MTSKPIVTVNEGKILGIKKQSQFSGVEYFSFFGVPYGHSTAKRARFKDPIKARPWKNVLDATVGKEGCTQVSVVKFHTISGSEDCLYNNIHTPKLPSKGDSLRPVVFLIHAGAFYHGSPDTWYYGSPDYVMHQDIVYVCVAYRLHILGFLNLELQECSGDQAVKDIILSLNWLKENISSFGGDPNNITLLGNSSGATMIHTLLLTPAARGLFHKAVMMGAYFFNPIHNTCKRNIKFAIEIARLYGYDVTDLDEATMSIDDKKRLLEYLKKIQLDHRVLVNQDYERHVFKDSLCCFPSSVFAEAISIGENRIYSKHPRELIKSMARVPLIFGICEKEAVFGFIRRSRPDTVEPLYQSYKQNLFGWGRNVNDDQMKIIREKIDSFYFNGNSMESATLSEQIDVQTDIAFSDVHDTLLNVVDADLPSSVYVYKFQFQGNTATMDHHIQKLLDEPVEGTYHSADFTYWAQINEFWEMRNEPLSLESEEMVETFTKFITTFARTGNPNHENSKVQWKPSTIENPCYLSINDELKMVDGKLNGKRMEFWEDLKKQFYKDN